MIRLHKNICVFTIPKHVMFILNDMSLVMSTLRACYDDYVNIYSQCHIASLRVYNKERGRVSYSLYPSVVAVVPTSKVVTFIIIYTSTATPLQPRHY